MNSYDRHYRRFRAHKPMAALCGIALILPMRPIICGAADSTQESAISGLVSQLSADDANARREAAAKLVEIGDAARPAVLAAAGSDDPETRLEAQSVLLKLPWSAPGDPPEVKAILDQYTTYQPPVPDLQPPGVVQIPRPAPVPTAENRKTAVMALADLPGGDKPPDFSGFPALIRLEQEEPSESVRWTIEFALRTTDDGSHLGALRQMTPPPADAPMQALCGMAWMAFDAEKAKPMLERAVEVGFASPADDGGELDFVDNQLTDVDVFDHQYDAAADWMRKELKANPPTDEQGVPLPLLRLFALHAGYGPLAGYQQDYQAAGDSLASPKIQYALAHMADRQKEADKAASLRKDAFNASSDSREARMKVGQYLAEQGWDDDAEAELKGFLAMPSGDEDADAEVDVHFQLAELAIRRGDDFEAAQQKKDAMSLMGGGNGALIVTDASGHTWPVTENEIWAEIQWRFMKAALKSGDRSGADEHLNELLKLSPSDEEIATDVVPLLRSRKQTDQAEQLYAAAYRAAAAKLAADPTNPSLQNDVAWLDAECDENLSEAMKLSTAAVAGAPSNAAAIDTLADVNFKMGNANKAVELETKALTLQPGDKFMTGQLAKFKAAEKK